MRKSSTIYIMKSFAIFSVLCAHTAVVPDGFSPVTRYIACFMSEIGAIGVGIFFVISGYLFIVGTSRDKGYIYFFKNKIHSILIPWFISATLVYVYVAMRKGGSLSEYIMSMFGYLSAYWYLSVLVILYVLFYFISQGKHLVFGSIIMIILSGISVGCRMLGVINQNAVGVYLNVFNWSIFFAVGVLVGYKKICWKNNLILSILLAVIGIVFLLCYPLVSNREFSYFSFVYIPVELVIVYIVYLISSVLTQYNNWCVKLLRYVGRSSFAIYLYNDLLWSGLVVNLCNRIDSVILVIVRPFVVGICVILELSIGRKIAKRIGKEALFASLTGMGF